MMKKPNKKTVLIVSVLVILCLGIWTLWPVKNLEKEMLKPLAKLERLSAHEGFR